MSVHFHNDAAKTLIKLHLYFFSQNQFHFYTSKCLKMFRNMNGQFFKSYGASVNLGYQQGILNLLLTSQQH